MSDFFSALAARVVQRQGDGAAAPVRPRLPALFETAPSGFGEDPGDRIDSVENTPLAAPAPSLSPAPVPPAPGHGRAEELVIPLHASPLAEAAPHGAVAAPPAGIAVAPTAAPLPAPVVQAWPERANPAPVRTTAVEVSELGPVARPAAPPPPETPHAEAPDRSAPEAIAGARRATPQPPSLVAPAPRIAQGAAPRGPAPPPQPETTIEVAIGRIEVRAAPAPAERRAHAPGSPVMSLEAYLQSRTGRPAR